MVTSVKQDRDLLESVIASDLLDDSIRWIKSNMIPDHVFDRSDLDDWAIENGYVKSDE